MKFYVPYILQCVAQLVMHPTPDFSSGHDLTVCGIEPHIGLYTDSVEPAWDSLSPSLSAPAHALSHSQNKQTNFSKMKEKEGVCFIAPFHIFIIRGNV